MTTAFRSAFFLAIVIYVCALPGMAQRQAAFSPDGAWIFTADFDSLKFRLFDARSRKFIGEINPGLIHPKVREVPEAFGRIPIGIPSSFVRFSPDSKTIYLQQITEESGTLVSWNIAQQKPFTIKDVYLRNISPNGQTLYLNNGKFIQIYDVQSRKVSKKVKVDGSPQISTDGKNLALTRIDGGLNYSEVKFIELATSKVIKQINRSGQIYSGVYSPDGKWFCATSYREDPMLMFWDPATGTPLDSIPGEYYVQFSRDSKTILGMEPTGQYREEYDAKGGQLWNGATHKLLATIEGNGNSFTGAMFTPDGSKVALTLTDGNLIICDAQSGDWLSFILGYSTETTLVAFDEESKYLLTSDDQSFKMWEVNTGNLLFSLEGNSVVLQDDTGNFYQQELSKLKEALDRDNTADNLFNLGMFYENLDYYTKAIEWYKKASEANPSTLNLVKLGDMYLNKSEADNAISAYQKAMESNPVEFFTLNRRPFKNGILMGSPCVNLGWAYELKGNKMLSAAFQAKGRLIEGKGDEALKLLEKAAAEGYDIGSESFFYSDLKDHAKYQELLVRYPTK